MEDAPVNRGHLSCPFDRYIKSGIYKNPTFGQLTLFLEVRTLKMCTASPSGKLKSPGGLSSRPSADMKNLIMLGAESLIWEEVQDGIE